MDDTPRTIIGLDAATRCGVCLWTDMGAGQDPVIRLDSWNIGRWPRDHRRKGEDARNAYEKSAILSLYLVELLRQERKTNFPITAAVVEDPMKVAPSDVVITASGKRVRVPKSNAHSMTSGPTICGGTAAIFESFHVPVDLVRPQSWHAVALPGVKKPKGAPSNFWKREMMFRAASIGLRYGFEASNHDEADALGMTIWAVAQSGRLPVGVLSGKGPNLFNNQPTRKADA